MHPTFALTTALFAVAGLAAPTTRDYEETFSLSVTASDGSGTYNGNMLNACHVGAAVEALCVLDGASGSIFTFNERGPSRDVPGDTTSGFLVYTLPSQPTPEVQPLRFYRNETSNVNAGFFGRGDDPVNLAFDSKNRLGYYVSDTETQFTWFVCPQTYLTYDYPTVSFVKDYEEPDNEDCYPVTVYRKF